MGQENMQGSKYPELLKPRAINTPGNKYPGQDNTQGSKYPG